jgi:hypothetical protein
MHSCSSALIPGPCNGHVGKLEDSIIGCGKLAVGGEARHPRVFEVPLDDRTHPSSSLRLVLCVRTR